MFRVFLNDPLILLDSVVIFSFSSLMSLNLSILLHFFLVNLAMDLATLFIFSREAILCLTDFMYCSFSPHVINFRSDLYYFLLFTALGFGFSCLFLRPSDLSFGPVSTVTLVFLM